MNEALTVANSQNDELMEWWRDSDKLTERWTDELAQWQTDSMMNWQCDVLTVRWTDSDKLTKCARRRLLVKYSLLFGSCHSKASYFISSVACARYGILETKDFWMRPCMPITWLTWQNFKTIPWGILELQRKKVSGDGRTDGRTDGPTDGRTDRHSDL